MKALFIFTALFALSFADVFDARDSRSAFGTISQSKSNIAQYSYYLDQSGNDKAPNCGILATDISCLTFAAAKAQFYPKPNTPVEPNSEDYDGLDDPKYIDAQKAYAAAVARYPVDLAESQKPVTINIGSETNQIFSDTFMIDEHRTISITKKPEDQYKLVLTDKINPALPIFEVKSGSLIITDLIIEHYESDAASDKGIIDFSSINKEDNDLTGLLSISLATFRQRDWKSTQTRPYITFISDTASFELTSSSFRKTKISTEGVSVKNAVGFTFNSNYFIDIDGATGNENLVHLVDVLPDGAVRTLNLVFNYFIRIGKSSPVNDVLFVEQTGTQTSFVQNKQTLLIDRNYFIGTAAKRCGGLDFIPNGYDLFIYNTVFYDTVGTTASDILVSGDNLIMFEYQFDRTHSTPTNPDKPSIIIGDKDLTKDFVNSQTTFTVVDGTDASVYADSYLTIGEAISNAKLGKLDEEILVQLSPGRHTKDGSSFDSLQIGRVISVAGGLSMLYPQKVAIVGNGERPIIERSTSNAFLFTVNNQGSLRLNNLHVTTNGLVVDAVFLQFNGDAIISIDDVEFVNNNHPEYNLISTTGFTDVSITNSVFKNNIASRLISATLARASSKIAIQGSTFSNEEYINAYQITGAAIQIFPLAVGDVKITGNTFKYVKVGTNSAPIYILGQPSTIRIEHNTFEDNTGGVARAVQLNSVGLGRIEDILFSNIIIKSRDKGAYIPVYLVDQEDYSYLIPEYINRRYVVKGEAPAGTIPEEVFASLPDAIGGIIGSSPAKLFINIIGGTEGHEASTVNKPLLSLEIVGVDHIEEKLAKKEDEPQFKYEEVLGVQLNQSGSFIIDTYRSLDLRNLNITYKGIKSEFLIVAKEGAVLTVKNTIFDVPEPEKTKKVDTDGYVGYVNLQGKNVASFANVKFGAMLLKNPLGEFSTGAAIVGRNVIGLAVTDTVFTDIVINNESLAVSAIRVGLIHSYVDQIQHTSGVVSISNSIFEQADVKKNNKQNKNAFDKEFKTPAVYLWTELSDDGTKNKTGIVSINNTKFTHCRGGAIRIRDIDAKIGASSRFAKNLPRFKNFKTFQANIQIEGESILEAEEESFVKEGTKDKNSYSWILPSNKNITIKGTVAKNLGARLFTLPVLSKASGKYNTSINGAIVTLNGKRLYPLGDLKVEIFEEGKEQEAIALGVRQQYVNDKYKHKETKLYYQFPLDVEEDKKKSWRVRLVYGLGKRTKDVKLKIK